MPHPQGLRPDFSNWYVNFNAELCPLDLIYSTHQRYWHYFLIFSRFNFGPYGGIDFLKMWFTLFYKKVLINFFWHGFARNILVILAIWLVLISYNYPKRDYVDS